MNDYPSLAFDLVNGFADVVREEYRFDVIINPCLVTQLEPAVIPEKIEYTIGSIRKSITYTYTQYPCVYDATYTIKGDNGGSPPNFVRQLERYPLITIYSVDELDVGSYTIEITIILDNIELFS